MSRISRLQADLDDGEAFYISHPINVRYLCGFHGSFGSLLITSAVATLFTDSRYGETARRDAIDVTVNDAGHALPPIDALQGVSTIRYEKNFVTVATLEKLERALSAIRLEGHSGIVERMRLVKDSSEVELVRQAAATSTAALAATVAQIRVGQTEKFVQRLLEDTMLDLGADAIAFDSIVATGPHSAIPHHNPTDRIIEPGDFLKIDFGAEFGGYKSDCTRTFVMGEPADWQREVYEQVRVAQFAGREAVKPGAVLSDVNIAARQAISRADFAATFQHGLGHGVGLAIHEDPFFSPHATAKIGAGMVITIEPGIYLAGRGGVRIEDTLVVTPTGYENLTEFSYDLISLG